MFLAYFKMLSSKKIEQQKLRLSKECGTIVLNGQELRIIDIREENYIVQDVHGEEKPRAIPKNDASIDVALLHPAFL